MSMQLQLILFGDNGYKAKNFIRSHKNWAEIFDNAYFIMTERPASDTFDILHGILGDGPAGRLLIVPIENENPLDSFKGWHKDILWRWVRRLTTPLPVLFKMNYKMSWIEELFLDEELLDIYAESLSRQQVLDIYDRRLEEIAKEKEDE